MARRDGTWGNRGGDDGPSGWFSLDERRRLAEAARMMRTAVPARKGVSGARRRTWRWLAAWCCAAGWGLTALQADANVYLTGVPDYRWYGGCYGTATGNLIGYWDRHGFPNFYTGPTAGGMAPLDDYGEHKGIRNLWTSKAGRDGRPADQPGHEDDYYVEFESTADDPYVTAGRAEHPPDCIGDFIGLSQKKWRNMAGECDGNIDGYAFVYWDKTGARRVNYQPDETAGLPALDVQSGLRKWARHCGYYADTFTQLGEFNPEITGPGVGFRFEDVQAEIDAGYPLLVQLQAWNTFHRAMGDMPRANPEVHAILIYGYYVTGNQKFVRVRTSWGSGDNVLLPWTSDSWLVNPLRVRGVLGFHPRPQIVDFQRHGRQITLRWVGPDSVLYDALTGKHRRVHWYVVERALSLEPGAFEEVSAPTTDREWTGEDCCTGVVFYRIKLVPPP